MNKLSGFNSRFREHVEQSDAFRWLGRVQMIQSGHGVDDPEHDRCFYPVIHQVEVGQTHWKQHRQVSSDVNVLKLELMKELELQ